MGGSGGDHPLILLLCLAAIGEGAWTWAWVAPRRPPLLLPWVGGWVGGMKRRRTR